jgi:hypothetical protein
MLTLAKTPSQDGMDTLTGVKMRLPLRSQGSHNLQTWLLAASEVLSAGEVLSEPSFRYKEGQICNSSYLWCAFRFSLCPGPTLAQYF